MTIKKRTFFKLFDISFKMTHMNLFYRYFILNKKHKKLFLISFPTSQQHQFLEQQIAILLGTCSWYLIPTTTVPLIDSKNKLHTYLISGTNTLAHNLSLFSHTLTHTLTLTQTQRDSSHPIYPRKANLVNFTWIEGGQAIFTLQIRISRGIVCGPIVVRDKIELNIIEQNTLK